MEQWLLKKQLKDQALIHQRLLKYTWEMQKVLRAIWEDVLRWKQDSLNLFPEYSLTVSVHPDLKP